MIIKVMPREFQDAEAARNCSAGIGIVREAAELRTAASLTMPREFQDAEAARNCSAGIGIVREAAELRIRRKD